MGIRALTESDIDQVRAIHERHYKTEFDFPDFLTNFLCAFVVEEDGQVISAGGVRNIAEVVLVTNKDLSVRQRRAALFQVLDASAFIAGRSGHDGLHVFIQDDKWEFQLRKIGFHSTKGRALVLGL